MQHQQTGDGAAKSGPVCQRWFRKDQQRDINADRSPLEYSPRKEAAKQVCHALQECARLDHVLPHTSENQKRAQHEDLHPSVHSELAPILLHPEHHPNMEPAARVCYLSLQLRYMFMYLQAATAVQHLLSTS